MNICLNVGMFGFVNNNWSKYPIPIRRMRLKPTKIPKIIPMIIPMLTRCSIGSSVYKTLDGQHNHSKTFSIYCFGLTLFFKLTIAKNMFRYIIYIILLCLHAYSTYRITYALYNRIKPLNFHHKVSFGNLTFCTSVTRIDDMNLQCRIYMNK